MIWWAAVLWTATPTCRLWRHLKDWRGGPQTSAVYLNTVKRLAFVSCGTNFSYQANARPNIFSIKVRNRVSISNILKYWKTWKPLKATMGVELNNQCNKYILCNTYLYWDTFKNLKQLQLTSNTWLWRILGIRARKTSRTLGTRLRIPARCIPPMWTPCGNAVLCGTFGTTGTIVTLRGAFATPLTWPTLDFFGTGWWTVISRATQNTGGSIRIRYLSACTACRKLIWRGTYLAAGAAWTFDTAKHWRTFIVTLFIGLKGSQCEDNILRSKKVPVHVNIYITRKASG